MPLKANYSCSAHVFGVSDFMRTFLSNSRTDFKCMVGKTYQVGDEYCRFFYVEVNTAPAHA